MNHGKETCRILKELRHKIAEANDIVLETSECRFKGDCTGTCPRCESEVRYLERQLAARRRAGKAIRLAGLAQHISNDIDHDALPDPINRQHSGRIVWRHKAGIDDTSDFKNREHQANKPINFDDEPELMGDIVDEKTHVFFGRLKSKILQWLTHNELTGDIDVLADDVDD